MKKKILLLGSFLTVMALAPVVVVSCGNTQNEKQPEPVKPVDYLTPAKSAVTALEASVNGPLATSKSLLATANSAIIKVTDAAQKSALEARVKAVTDGFNDREATESVIVSETLMSHKNTYKASELKSLYDKANTLVLALNDSETKTDLTNRLKKVNQEYLIVKGIEIAEVTAEKSVKALEVTAKLPVLVKVQYTTLNTAYIASNALVTALRESTLKTQLKAKLEVVKEKLTKAIAKHPE